MIELCRTDYHFNNWRTMQWIIADTIILIFCIIAFNSTIQKNVRSAKIDKMKSAASHQDVQHFSQDIFLQQYSAIFKTSEFAFNHQLFLVGCFAITHNLSINAKRLRDFDNLSGIFLWKIYFEAMTHIKHFVHFLP